LHAFPSEHDVPFVSLFVWQTPDPLQVSGLSQAVSSELPHAVPGFAGGPDSQRPLVVLQFSGPLQTFPSLVQVVVVPTWHDPFWQLSPTVHALPSVHDDPFARSGFEQTPVAGLQVPATWHWSSAVHVTPVQRSVVPAHMPPVHTSFVVFGLPSSHAKPFASVLVWQLPDPLQVSGLSQAVSDELPQEVPLGALLPLVQVPDWQLSLCVQALPSLQDVPFVRLAWSQVFEPTKGNGVVAQVVTPVSVPAIPPTESTAVVPDPALKLQRCMSPAEDTSSIFMFAWISACVLAEFQILSSSTRPAKGKLGAP